MITEIEDVFSNEDQYLEESSMHFEDYISNIRYQTAVTQPDIYPTDYFEKFIEDFLKKDISTVEDRTIYINSDIDEHDKEYLIDFIGFLREVFDSGYGISILNGDIYHYYCLYNVLIINFIDYFTIYLNGLQKLNDKFVEDIPNFSEFSFENFKKMEKNIVDIDKLVLSYIDYIAENGIFNDNFFEIMLLESEGNVILSELYIKEINLEIITDQFFSLKLKKILSSVIIKDVICKKFIETNKLFTSNSSI